MSFKNILKSYFTMEDEEYEYLEEEPMPDSAVTSTTDLQDKKKVVNLKSVQRTSTKVVLYEPKSYSEAQEVADNIVNRRAVVINLQRVENPQAKRIVDFLSGTIYAVNGDIQKIGIETFLCTPDNVAVSGTITDTLSEPIEEEN